MTRRRPSPRLSNYGDRMIAAVDLDDDVRAIILLDDDHEGAAVVHGYDNPDEAVDAILGHLRALLESLGHRVVVTGISEN